MTPRFTVLLDWVEGRLPATEAAEVAALVRVDPRAQETVAWIEEFRGVGRSAPLVQPPEELRASLRSMFSRLHAHEGPEREATLSHDTRDHRIHGVRAPAVDMHDLEHVVVSDGSLRIVLTLLRGQGDDVDVRGRVEQDAGALVPLGAEVVLVAEEGPPRVARLGSDGAFTLTGVSARVRELWYFGDDLQFRCRLSLERR